MRVTARTYYQDYASTVNDLHSKLNESMEKVSTGKKYKDASENPIAYYAGKRMDNQYTDADAKYTIISDVKNRLYQQEKGALSIQEDMRAVNTKIITLNNATMKEDTATVGTFETEFTQRLNSMVNTLNSQYDNFYVYGGNDMTTVPFSLKTDLDSADPSISLVFSHKFPGEDAPTDIEIRYRYDSTKKLYYNSFSVTKENGTELAPPADDAEKKANEEKALSLLLSAMREQGKMSTGYGSLRDRSTLLDTYTGGLNMITGLSSDTLKSLDDDAAKERISGKSQADGKIIPEEDSLVNSPIALLSKAILSAHQYIRTMEDQSITDKSVARERFDKDLSDFINQNDDAESRVSNTYRELGVKYSALESTQSRLELTMDTLKSEYTDKLGIDTYDAIVQMYSYQYSYNAAMKVGSNIMQSSLFDFVK